MKCPKCDGAMRSYERNGITIDQCTECRGVFLDRGELDRLIDAEATVAPPPPVAPTFNPGQPAPAVRPQQNWDRDDDDDRYRDNYRDHSGGYRKKKKSFLSEIFDV